MGLISKETETTWIANNKEYYIKRGYEFTKMRTKLIVNIKDLKDNSVAPVEVKCDGCGKKYKIKWQTYKNTVKENGTIYCIKCAHQLYGGENLRLTLLKQNGISFKQWCIDNNKQDVLDLWDYELNGYNPDEIGYSTRKKFWFKCPKGIHQSELKNINSFTNNSNKHLIHCNQCNSFGQWLIDNYGDNAIELYWSHTNTISPFEISYRSSQKVWIICQKKKYHNDYLIICDRFVSGNRCPYCCGRKVHKFDSLGYLYPEVLNIWSDKNNKSPFDYAPKSNQKVWWKCKNKKHKDYQRIIQHANAQSFRCAFCQSSKGETRIEEYLITNLINYDAQVEYEDLLGIGNGNLSYDFFINKYNLLIEYQGEQHERPIDFTGKGISYAKKAFKKQKEHDKRKRKYAELHDIKLLEIWYWDYENIEKILSQELNLLSNSF